jgi:hypothetical protein
MNTTGTIHLANAPGMATITREIDTGIAHIHADDIFSAAYA